MKHRHLTMTAWPLLLVLAIAPAAQAEEGNEREFGGRGYSEADACEDARQSMHGQNSVARGGGSCERCETERRGSYPYAPTGEYWCGIWGVEQASDEMILVLPSSDDDADVDDDEDAQVDAEEVDEDAGADEEGEA